MDKQYNNRINNLTMIGALIVLTYSTLSFMIGFNYGKESVKQRLVDEGHAQWHVNPSTKEVEWEMLNLVEKLQDLGYHKIAQFIMNDCLGPSDLGVAPY